MRALAMAVVASCVALPSCSSASSPGAADPGADAAASPEGGPDGGGGLDASEGGAVACVGACTETSLVASFGGKSAPIDRAQHGIERGDGGTSLHVEAHHGGDPACPTQSSPTPERTIVLAGIASGRAPATLTEKDGVAVTFLDFKGDLLGATPLSRATKATVSVVAIDSATPPGWVALDLDATFAEGTIRGHLYATYCASMTP